MNESEITPLVIDTETLTDLYRQGYYNIEAKGDKLCGITPFIFTVAIVCGINANTYDFRYCYHNLQEALIAFNDWDGIGEPEGYIKRKP